MKCNYIAVSKDPKDSPLKESFVFYVIEVPSKYQKSQIIADSDLKKLHVMSKLSIASTYQMKTIHD